VKAPTVASYTGAAVYAVLVFAGTALLGFVIAPLLGIASGAFPIEAEAQGIFSLLTLKGIPFLVALGGCSGLLYERWSKRPLPVRIAVFGANVLVVWLIAAATALVILG
jgi:hypothetical protein